MAWARCAAVVAWCHVPAVQAYSREALIGQYLDSAIAHVREARDAVLAGDADTCGDAVKRAKQSMKEVAGTASDLSVQQDSVSKPIQESLRALQDTQALCTPENGNRAVATLGVVADRLQGLRPNPGAGPRP